MYRPRYSVSLRRGERTNELNLNVTAIRLAGVAGVLEVAKEQSITPENFFAGLHVLPPSTF